MPDEDLRYDRMVEEALRSVVGRALSHAAKHGLPGNHHFYITFRTDDPRVQVPARLRERYPGEMTIVLQYQFWDLDVSEDGFSVTLSFGDKAEKLSVPFQAVVAFADPSVQFGLQFDVGKGDKAAAPAEIPAGPTSTEATPGAGLTSSGDSSPGAANGGGAPRDRDDAVARSENVVPLDTFRKKST